MLVYMYLTRSMFLVSSREGSYLRDGEPQVMQWLRVVPEKA